MDKKEKEKENSESSGFVQWTKKGSSTFIPADNSSRIPILDPGFYKIRYNDEIGFYLFKKDLKLDELIRLSFKESDEILDGIKDFWERKEKFKEYGFAYKRGILLYGPPGSGKTSIINILCDNLINDMGGIVLTITDDRDLDYYSVFVPETLRKIEPDRPIIVIIEDIDGICKSQESETQLINILDGIEQIENVVYIATTNYTEKLNGRIINRPNRFDRRIKIGFPNNKVREEYIKFKLKPNDLEKIDLKNWVNKTKEFTLAHIGELIKSVIILGNDFEKTVRELKKLKDIPQSHDYNKYSEDDDEKSQAIGFVNYKVELD